MSATIEISTKPSLRADKKLVELRASLDGVRTKYKGTRRGEMVLENDGSFAGTIKLDQAEDMLAVARAIPRELFGLIIKRMPSETGHK